MTCKKCGYESHESASFCAACGARLTEEGFFSNIPLVIPVSTAAAVVILFVGAILAILAAQDTADVAAARRPPSTNPDRLSSSYFSHDSLDATAEYVYDAYGQLVQKIQDNANWVTEYFYDNNGNLQRESVSVDGQVQEVIEYDQHGTITARASGSDSGELVYHETYTNEYDNRGRLTEQTMMDNENSGSTKTYTYLSDGGYIIEYTDFLMEQGEQVPHCHRIGIFTRDDTLLACYEDLNNLAPQHEVRIVTLDQYGNPLKIVTDINCDGSLSHVVSEFTNNYREDGQLSSVEEYTSTFLCTDGEVQEDSDLELNNTTFYTYDANGNLTSRVRTFEEDDEVQETVWEYDSWGNLIHVSGYRRMYDLEVFLMGDGSASAAH